MVRNRGARNVQLFNRLRYGGRASLLHRGAHI